MACSVVWVCPNAVFLQDGITALLRGSPKCGATEQRGWRKTIRTNRSSFPKLVLAGSLGTTVQMAAGGRWSCNLGLMASMLRFPWTMRTSRGWRCGSSVTSKSIRATLPQDGQVGSTTKGSSHSFVTLSLQHKWLQQYIPNSNNNEGVRLGHSW